MSDEKFTISATDIIEAINVDRATIWRWVKSGDFPAPRKFGRRTYRWSQQQIRAYIDAAEVTEEV